MNMSVSSSFVANLFQLVLQKVKLTFYAKLNRVIKQI